MLREQAYPVIAASWSVIKSLELAPAATLLLVLITSTGRHLQLRRQEPSATSERAASAGRVAWAGISAHSRLLRSAVSVYGCNFAASSSNCRTIPTSVILTRR